MKSEYMNWNDLVQDRQSGRFKKKKTVDNI